MLELMLFTKRIIDALVVVRVSCMFCAVDSYTQSLVADDKLKESR